VLRDSEPGTVSEKQEHEEHEVNEGHEEKRGKNGFNGFNGSERIGSARNAIDEAVNARR
jgi:hypothetical protein